MRFSAIFSMIYQSSLVKYKHIHACMCVYCHKRITRLFIARSSYNHAVIIIGAGSHHHGGRKHTVKYK